METTTQVTFRHMPRSPALEADILEKVEHLQRYHERIIACRVAVEAPNHHHRKGGLFRVLVTIALPGEIIVTSHTHHDDHAHEDAYVAVRDAFLAARRQLEEQVHRRHAHDAP